MLVGSVLVSVLCLFLFILGYFRDGTVAYFLDTSEQYSRIFLPTFISVNVAKIFIPTFGPAAGFVLFTVLVTSKVDVNVYGKYFGFVILSLLIILPVLYILPIKYPDWMYPRKRHEWMRQKRFEEWNRGSVFRPSYKTSSWVGKGKLEVAQPVMFKNNPENEYDLYPRIDMSL